MIQRSCEEQRRLGLVALAFVLLLSSVGVFAEAESSTAGDADGVGGKAAQTESSQPTSGTSGPQSTPSRITSAEDREQQYRAPTAAELEREPALRKRVEARWAALIDRDFDTVYEFATPDYQAKVDRAEHAKSFGDLVQWHLASVKEVRYDQENEAEVIVSLTISVPLGESGTVKTMVPVPERWVYQDDQWYFETEYGQP